MTNHTAVLRLFRLPVLNQWYVRRSAHLLSRAGRVVVVCMGNTCRSPFLAGYLRRRATEIPVSLAPVLSRGLLQQDGLPSSEVAMQAAATFGVDLREHTSRSLHRERPQAHDVYVLVEPAHQERFRAWHGDGRPRVIYWGLLDPECPDPLIADPHQSDMETYLGTYGRIRRAAERVLREISREQ